MRLEWPLLLLSLLVVPAALATYLVLERRRARYAVRYTNLEVLAGVASIAPRWRRLVPAALVLLALTAALAALARPQVSVSAAREEASVALAIDTSGSMFAEDVKPTRLGAAQEAVRRFLEKLPEKYRVGMVTFSSEAVVAAPLTHDREVVLDGLEFLYPGAGTAIGDALARAVELLRPVTADGDGTGTGPQPPAAGGRDDDSGPLSAILLLSDGFQTRGLLTPLEGAARAKSFGIPIFTVALGTPNGTVTFNRGGFSRTVPVPPDPLTLRRIAQTTGGEFFAARNQARLNAVYEGLASRLGKRREWSEGTFVLLGAAALLLLGGGVLSTRWLNRLP